MIRSVLVIGEHGRLVYSHQYDSDTANSLNEKGVGALVSVVHNIIPLLTGSNIRSMKLADEHLLIHSNGKLVFVLSVDAQVTDEHERKLDFIMEQFTTQYEGIIPFLDEKTDLQVFNDFTSVLDESNMFP